MNSNQDKLFHPKLFTVKVLNEQGHVRGKPFFVIVISFSTSLDLNRFFSSYFCLDVTFRNLTADLNYELRINSQWEFSYKRVDKNGFCDFSFLFANRLFLTVEINFWHTKLKSCSKFKIFWFLFKSLEVYHRMSFSISFFYFHFLFLFHFLIVVLLKNAVFWDIFKDSG